MRCLCLMLAMLLPAASVTAAAPSGKGEARLAKMLKGRVAGTPVDCIDITRIDDSEIVDRTAIVYRVGSTLYVNRPDAGAQTLFRGDILVTDTVLARLCNVDIVRLIDPTQRAPKGFVNLGDFVPYARPGKR